jgi:predicted nucleic-acid-binding Zn-ribbon protein
MSRMTIWYEINCSECGAVNWLSGGDPEDLTGADIDGLRCYKCGFSEVFDHEITYMNNGDYKVEDVCELGLERPI